MLNRSPSEPDHINLCMLHTNVGTRYRLFGRPQMPQGASSPALFKEILLFEIACDLLFRRGVKTASVTKYRFVLIKIKEPPSKYRFFLIKMEAPPRSMVQSWLPRSQLSPSGGHLASGAIRAEKNRFSIVFFHV